MSQYEKTAPCNSSTRGGENSKSRAVSKSPQTDFTTPRDQSQAVLEAILPRGAENAVPVSSLAFRLGVTEREVRSLASEARARGVPVIARNCGGYYLAPPTAEGIQELITFTHRLRAIGAETLSTAAALERCVVELSGQLSIEEVCDVEPKE